MGEGNFKNCHTFLRYLKNKLTVFAIVLLKRYRWLKEIDIALKSDCGLWKPHKILSSPGELIC